MLHAAVSTPRATGARCSKVPTPALKGYLNVRGRMPRGKIGCTRYSMCSKRISEFLDSQTRRACSPGEAIATTWSWLPRAARAVLRIVGPTVRLPICLYPLNPLRNLSAGL